jgi:hypothetical protein
MYGSMHMAPKAKKQKTFEQMKQEANEKAARKAEKKAARKAKKIQLRETVKKKRISCKAVTKAKKMPWQKMRGVRVSHDIWTMFAFFTGLWVDEDGSVSDACWPCGCPIYPGSKRTCGCP